MSILKNIKQGVANSGSNKGKVIFVKDGDKKRVRFLHNIEDGTEVTMHDHYDRGINVICQKHLGKKCPFCKDSEVRHRQAYLYSVWDYDSKEVKLFMGFANNFNPLPALVSMYESYESLTDRDYVIKREGKSTNTKYTVVPMDKVKFKNKKAKPIPEKKVLSIMGKAFTDGLEDATEDEDETGVDTEEYDEMTPRELYMECMERGLDAKKKKSRQYYIDILVEDDQSDEDEEEEDEDDWDEDDDEDEDGEW